MEDTKTYVVQTGTGIIERCLLMTTDPGDLLLDPTCGSGTPTTGQIRSHSTDDIACWFIDTDYNEESFLVATPTSVAPTSIMRS